MALVPPHARALPSLAVSGHIKVSLNSICKWNLTLHFRGRTQNAFCFFALSSFEGNKIFDVSFEMQCTSNDLHHSVFPFESRLAIISRHNIYKKNNATLWWSCKLICTSAPAYHILSIDIPAHKNMQIFYAYAINYSSSTNLQTFSNIVPLWYARLMCRQNKNKQIFYANGMQVVSAGIDRQAAWLYYWFFRKSPNKHFLYCNRYMQAR